jgi:hypothetical protein
VAQQPIFQGAAGNLMMALVNYLIHRWSKENSTERRLHELEEKLVESGIQDRTVILEMLRVVEKLTSDLHTSLKQAVAPIGSSCSTLTMSTEISNALPIDVKRKEIILDEGLLELTDQRILQVLITELDIENASCKVRFPSEMDEDEEAKRYRAVISDPAIKYPNSAYSHAMASAKQLMVKGKIELKHGEINKIYILDIAA